MPKKTKSNAVPMDESVIVDAAVQTPAQQGTSEGDGDCRKRSLSASPSREQARSVQKRARRTMTTTSDSSSSDLSGSYRSHRKRYRKKAHKKSKKVHKHKRHRREVSSYEGESSSDNNIFINNRPYELPAITYGAKIGDNVKQSIIKKVRKNIFVDFSDLLPDHVNDIIDKDSEMCIQFSSNGSSIVKNKSRKTLNYTQWSEAFDIFMMIYIEEHALESALQVKLLTKDLLTYRSNVTTMLKENGDWSGFDQHFRKLMETQPVSWSTANFNLIWHYTNKKQAQNVQTVNQAKGRAHPYQKKQGTCYSYNTPNKRCQSSARECKYNHSCSACGSFGHPYYTCNSDRASASTSNGSNKGNRASAVGLGLFHKFQN